MNMLKALDYIIYGGSEALISHQDILQEIDQVNVVVDLVQPSIFKEGKFRIGQPDKELNVIVSIV